MCGPDCVKKAHAKTYTKTCEVCHQPFQCSTLRQRTCSRVCMGVLHRQRHAVDLTCKTCHKPFQISQGKVNEGRGLYCSAKCYQERPSNLVMPELQIRSLWSEGLSCRQIATRLELTVTTLKRWLKKQGLYEPRRHLANHGRWRGGTTSRPVRTLVLVRANNQCECCGYNKVVGILQIHHIDRNRENNAMDNLKLLCPNCHEEDHFMARDGRYS